MLEERNASVFFVLFIPSKHVCTNSLRITLEDEAESLKLCYQASGKVVKVSLKVIFNMFRKDWEVADEQMQLKLGSKEFWLFPDPKT